MDSQPVVNATISDGGNGCIAGRLLIAAVVEFYRRVAESVGYAIKRPLRRDTCGRVGASRCQPPVRPTCRMALRPRAVRSPRGRRQLTVPSRTVVTGA